ncbi:MAG: OmpA family protein [Phycisphaerales bacterium]|nr:MAG: OmpA family protein [Phycisphaerales bacterium]
MRPATKKTIALLICVVPGILLPGCADWKKRYDYLNVEHENLKGRYEVLQAEREQLGGQVSQDQQTIAELQRQIDELNRTPAQATGFEGYDVSFDPAAGTITVTLPNKILFASGKATLKSATSAELDDIYSVLRQKYAGKELDVVGHTDTDPIKKSPWKDNWELSAQRALSVARYLIKRGVPERQIQASGCGAARPIASNATASGKARNRRVEIVVHVR